MPRRIPSSARLSAHAAQARFADAAQRAKNYAIPEAIMGLPVTERRILGKIEQAIGASDPQLTSL